jgi:hypothetical protein
MRMTGARAAAAGPACAVALVLATVQAAYAAPELSLAAGRTLGVNGSPGDGGAGGSVAVLWPFEDRFVFGLVAYADDLGTALTDLHDVNTGAPLGTVAGRHRWGFGAGWRTEARLPERRRWRVLWGAEFGYGRQERDVRGEVDDAVSGVLVATGPSLLWDAKAGHSFGLTAAWKHAFVSREADAGRTTNWTTLAFAWRWRLSRQP